MKRMLALILVIICITVILPLQSVTAEEFSTWVGTATDIYQDAEIVTSTENEPLYMYDIPAVTGNRLLLLYEGDIVFVLRDNDQFAEVIYAEQTGYVQSSLLHLIDGTISPASDPNSAEGEMWDTEMYDYTEKPDCYDPTYGLSFGMSMEEIDNAMIGQGLTNVGDLLYTNGKFFGIPFTYCYVLMNDNTVYLAIIFDSEDSDEEREYWPDNRLENIDYACDCLKQAIISKLGKSTQSQHIGDTVYWITDDYLLLLSDTRYRKDFMMIQVIIGDYSNEFENYYK